MPLRAVWPSLSTPSRAFAMSCSSPPSTGFGENIVQGAVDPGRVLTCTSRRSVSAIAPSSAGRWGASSAVWSMGDGKGGTRQHPRARGRSASASASAMLRYSELAGRIRYRHRGPLLCRGVGILAPWISSGPRTADDGQIYVIQARPDGGLAAGADGALKATPSRALAWCWRHRPRCRGEDRGSALFGVIDGPHQLADFQLG